MKLNNKVYDILKWLVIVFLPALNVLIFGLGGWLGFDAAVVCGVLSCITTFIGSLIGISTLNYNKDKIMLGRDDEDDLK